LKGLDLRQSPDSGAGEAPKYETVFEPKDFTGNPVNFVGANIPSFYGGLSLNGWEKFKTKHLLPKSIIEA
jgi:hypothetical protein